MFRVAYATLYKRELVHISNSELRSCVKVEVAVLGFLSLTIFIASVDVKQHLKKNEIAVKSENCLLALRYSAINIPRTVFLVYISHGRAPMWTLAFTAWFT